MKIAAMLAMLVAVVLLVGAFSDWHEDSQTAPARVTSLFENARGRDYDELHRELAEQSSRETSEAVRALAGFAFLIAGIAMFVQKERAV